MPIREPIAPNYDLPGTSPGGGRSWGVISNTANNPGRNALAAMNLIHRLGERNTGSSPFRGLFGGGFTGDPDTNVIQKIFAPIDLPPLERTSRALDPQELYTWSQAFNISPYDAQNIYSGLSPEYANAVSAAASQAAANNRLREQWFKDWRDQMGAVYGSFGRRGAI